MKRKSLVWIPTEVAFFDLKQNSSTDICSSVISFDSYEITQLGRVIFNRKEQSTKRRAKNCGLSWISNWTPSLCFDLWRFWGFSRFEFTFSGSVCQRIRGWPDWVVGPKPHATGDIDGQNHDHDFGNQPSSSDKHSKDGFRFASVWTWKVWQTTLI